MLQTLQGLVLRSIKYGETSLITTAFTREHGVQTFMLKGVRKGTRTRASRSGLLQPASRIDFVAYHRPGQKMQLVREFSPACIYHQLQEEVVHNSVVLFSVELLLRLLPPEAPLEELYDFCAGYFEDLDRLPRAAIGNMPLYFVVRCGELLGYGLSGGFSQETPYLNLVEGAFTADAPTIGHSVSTEDADLLHQLLQAPDIRAVSALQMGSEQRYRLLDWYLEFLQRHTQHLSALKSLQVLRTVLH